LINNLIIIPTYNEIINSKLIYNKIRLQSADVDILFIDDSSPDNTSESILELIKTDQKLFLITRAKKLGVGSAHKEGFKWAISKNYKIITTIDADLSHDPSLIKEMHEKIQEYDIIITSRFLKSDSIEEWSIIRQVITRFRHLVVKTLLGMPIDSSGGFRTYNLRKINSEDLFLAKDNGYSFFWESMYFFYKKNYKILEIPMKQPQRIHGRSKIGFYDVYRAVTYLLLFYFKNLFK
jgi:dolichol-phosphate mannosyltransferase